ncbi:hypothetical protein [Brachybacterium sp. SGAir0954]|uniref:hypothetical protein n=1 Tax=Brachybacterium sp. SGAir0954 TaxID=2571029 RepID=UPI00272EE685|nr:hypothetical protein [Brachybacterium sp. SGAir0954]
MADATETGIPAKLAKVEQWKWPPMIARTSVPSSTFAKGPWSRSSTVTARSWTHGIGGWCRARTVPSGAGVASTSRSQAC